MSGRAAARLLVTGVVQGVGFRPFVYRLASESGLAGWVTNSPEGVVIHVEGERAVVDAFAGAVVEQAPPMAVVEKVATVEVAAEELEAFEIRGSETTGETLTLVSPDIATCDACLSEMRDPSDRRYRYPFINCTNCGPRFTIIDDIPYDRPATAMRDFPMCRACAAEYGDPGDRRFHAQPDACHVCGPRLYLNVRGRAPSGWEWDRSAETGPRRHRDKDAERSRTDDVLAAAVQMLQGGDILAIKGLGGFHLACDASSEAAVARLRERKRRWGKPFAVMFADVDAVRKVCEVSADEQALLAGPVRPIVLLARRGGGAGAEVLADSVAPGLGELGAMLPYTPLHHLLLTSFGRPLVMTSGNLSDEPIATGCEEALRRLAPIADGFLLHDRPISSRYDDSVVRVSAGRHEMIRRSRGYAPFPIALPFDTDTAILACGPEQKNTFCLARGRHAFVSQHIGDLENAETLDSFEETLERYERLFRIEPALVAYDLHPEYLSTKSALATGLPAIGVQHHHAHIVSAMAENGCEGPAVGLAFDGTGYGTDGAIWGGEVLVATWGGSERVAHLRYVPMPGGAAAIRRPARMALGLLLGLDGGLLEHPGLLHLRRTLTTDELTTLPAMVDRGLGSPPTSSMGRLFDAVSALAGVRYDAIYEGQAAIELEALADPGETGAYRFAIIEDEVMTIDPLPVIEELLSDLAAGATAPTVSARFHASVVEMAVRVAQLAAGRAGAREVALSGGVFMNRLVYHGVIAGLEGAGLVPVLHRELPVNDGCISHGQAVVAWSRRHEV